MSRDFINNDVDPSQTDDEFEENEMSAEAAAFHQPFPVYPKKLAVSGLYKATNKRLPLPIKSKFSEQSSDEFENEIGFFPGKKLPLRRTKEELRLDVDGHYPQMQASGMIRINVFTTVHWIARLKSTGNSNTWKGNVWFKDGPANAMRHTRVLIKVKRSWYSNQRQLIATFSGGGAPTRVRHFKFNSAHFHPAEFEYDRVSDVPAADATTAINTCDHPNRPATIACENLSLETVYRRAGFNVSKSGNDSPIPIDDAGGNATWSDAEMHDAMQAYWSRFSNKAQWSMWVMFARLHDSGTGLGGIMFDDIGPNHRQGTAIFTDSFIAQAPVGEANPAAWVERMRFWTAAHEMGHGFNLAHSWQKSLGTPWLPTLADEPEARSFMNYPFNVSGGENSFFSDFENRFSDSELLFMRHAPTKFVQMGNADWFEDHGFEQAIQGQPSPFRLELRTNKASTVFEFLEMVNLELKLTNISGQTRLLEAATLKEYQNMAIIIKRDGMPARQWLPYASYVRDSQKAAIDHGQSIYDSLLLSAGKNGWDIAEPGGYTVQAMMTINDEVVVSNSLKLRVATPKTHGEEICAQDLFAKEVGQVLTYGGSQFLESANNALEEVIVRLPESNAARHAQIALALPKLRNFKSLNITADAPDLFTALEKKQASIHSVSTDSSVNKVLDKLLVKEGDAAAETLGHICYKKHMDTFSQYLAQQESASSAEKIQQACQKTLMARDVPEWVFANDAHRSGSPLKKGSKKKAEKA
ncbi:FIG00986726: hypothetical protein [hydrothermal vent metagenome]|uniref:Uncharacterized protein n=1 Tax=hydrothermal vent metagenome TaxID=652676 RepID=A0A3B1A2R4_9ZZZZ